MKGAANAIVPGGGSASVAVVSSVGSLALSSAGAAAAVVGGNVVLTRIGKSGGYTFDHHYPDDHDPIHVHIKGDDGKTKVDLNGNPLKGNRPMSFGERKAFKNLLGKIREALLPWIK